jgi:hypothetical protein
LWAISKNKTLIGVGVFLFEMLMLSLLKKSCDTQWVSDGYPLGIMKKKRKKKKKKISQFLHYVMPLDMGITKIGLALPHWVHIQLCP